MNSQNANSEEEDKSFNRRPYLAVPGWIGDHGIIRRCGVHESDILATRETTNRSMELCHTLLGFIAKSASPEELAESILNHLPREEYQKLLDELEKRKAPPAESMGTLKILVSEGEAEFGGRFNSRYLLDAFRAMTGDSVKVRYRMDGRVTQHSVLLGDDTDNIHILMPMKVE